MVGFIVPPCEMVNEKSQNHKEWAGYFKESNVEEQRKPQRDPSSWKCLGKEGKQGPYVGSADPTPAHSSCKLQF